ncbi:MAG: hypothetical protein MHPSP_000432 [Paramarteilia canceri]
MSAATEAKRSDAAATRLLLRKRRATMAETIKARAQKRISRNVTEARKATKSALNFKRIDSYYRKLVEKSREVRERKKAASTSCKLY